ncbi:NlpC/P60 family protein [uncultured Paludibaculum sp.]|uniref:C40 family peptidase n=1 Tax=uncultured Paludibaculum sp. TaxID=1765020 RepID=UPI002AAAA3DC|nr:NlpC/P60 family protein [uncultured Paludibaculum sp.]
MAESRAVVLQPVLDMYSKPSLDADVVSQALYGMTVQVTAEQEGWLNITTPGDDYPGWIERSSVRILKDGESYPAAGRTVTVQALLAHVYREPSVTKHRPLVSLPFETRLEVVADQTARGDRWLQVRLPDGRTGSIQNGDVTESPKTLEVPKIIELAHRFLGRPYTWGGRSSAGYDCSGFVQMLVRRGGVDLPRDAKPQALWEKVATIERKDLRPGDLVYFGPSVQKINHTGFYVGNGEFIHSTTNTHPVIQISKLDDQPWTKLLVACRRWKQ